MNYSYVMLCFIGERLEHPLNVYNYYLWCYMIRIMSNKEIILKGTVRGNS